MIRKLLSCAKCIIGARRSSCVLPLLVWAALVLVSVSWLQQVGRVLLPPPPPDQDLHHFRRNRNLQHYLDNIDVLIEPSSVCPQAGPVPVVVVVSSSPGRGAARRAIRESWGARLPTYFVLGLPGGTLGEALVDVYVEAKQYSDVIVLDMPDHYQNLTLKTTLMLQWTQARCPQAEWLFKTDDDVLVNPWTLKKLLQEHNDAKLLGYLKAGTKLHRDEYTKWFVPRWLHPADLVPEYLSGTGYLVRGKYIDKILTAAKKVPLINLEDVYLTYLVSKRSLNLDLSHDSRLSPYRPWLPMDCAYFNLASMHSLKPNEIANAWPRIDRKGKEFENDGEVCKFYAKHFGSEWFLY